MSDEGSLHIPGAVDDHVAIVTYWRSFGEHEKLHADSAFKAGFAALAKLCADSKELGYEMLWQGESAPGH